MTYLASHIAIGYFLQVAGHRFAQETHTDSYGSTAHCFTRCTAPSRCRTLAAANKKESYSDEKRLAREAAGASRRAALTAATVGRFAAGGRAASDPRLAGRPAPRVERFTYAVDGADDRTTFYGAAFTAADATRDQGVVLFHTAAGPRDRFVEWMAERLVAAGYTAVVADLSCDAWGSGWDAAWAAGPREALKDPAVLAERAPAAVRAGAAGRRRGRCGARAGAWVGGRPSRCVDAGLRAAVSFHGVPDAECLREALQTDEPPPGLLLCHRLADRLVPAFGARGGARRAGPADVREALLSVFTKARFSTPGPGAQFGGRVCLRRCFCRGGVEEGGGGAFGGIATANTSLHTIPNISGATHARPDRRGATPRAAPRHQHAWRAARRGRPALSGRGRAPMATPAIADMNSSTA